MLVSDDGAILSLGPAAGLLTRGWDAEPHEATVARARSDPEAFAAIYRAYYPAVVGYLYRRLGDVHTAEDVAAETFIRALRGIGRYEPRGLPLKAWLLRIATNEAHRRARRDRRLKERTPATFTPAGAECRAGPDELRTVLAAFAALPARWQDVLALHHLEGLSMDQAALVLGCRPGTVKSRLARAREALRRELERRRYGHD